MQAVCRVLIAMTLVLALATEAPAAPQRPPKPKRAATTQTQPQLTRADALKILERQGVREIVFAERSVAPEHWYANFSHTAYGTDKTLYGKQGRLCKLDLNTGRVTSLLDDSEGAVRDPCVDYDGRRIVFAWRKGGSEHYHLYEIQADGTGLKQLTGGPYDDFEPCTLPDGGIVFVSSRCRRYVNCWISQVATIYRCDADGQNIRQLSANIEHDNTPWVLPDGRILYLRWEYVDRSQVNYHHLWTMNPDGTGQAVYYGNQQPGGAYLDAKPIPGAGRVVLSLSPGHGQMEHQGKLATVDAARGPDEPAELKPITKSAAFRDPWALDPGHYLAALDNNLVLLDERGAMGKIHTIPTTKDTSSKKGNLWLHEPRPLAPRKREPVIAPRVDAAQPTGRFLLGNAAFGRNMDGVKPGEIKKLLVLETLPKPVNFTGGMDPLSYVGTFTLERVLGTVPVEPDGSAYFEAPAQRSLFFVALDGRDTAIKRMQSFTSVAPGETLGCLGCHERRTQAGAGDYAKKPQASLRAPSRIEPLAGMPDVPDFPRDIQPILDRHCLKCHDVGQRRGGVLLGGDRGPMFSHGYYSLVVWGQVADGRNLAKSNYPPRALGSGGSALMKKLEPTHHGVRVTDRERRLAQLWLDAGAPYPGTYAALGTGMIGGYQINKEVLENDEKWPEAHAARAAFARRCAACHASGEMSLPQYLADENGLSFWQPDMKDPLLKRNRHIVFNLTRPQKSVYLLAPLARAAGGYGICRPREAINATTETTKADKTGLETEKQTDGIFADREDPDYRTLLVMIQTGKRRLGTIKRFDMAGFRPREEYVREMKRYGVLPAAFDGLKDPLNVYETDRKYWDLFIWPGKQ